jgi:hypothetical protein
MDDSKKRFGEFVSDKIAGMIDFCDEHGLAIIVAGSLISMTVVDVVITKSYDRMLLDVEKDIFDSLK